MIDSQCKLSIVAYLEQVWFILVQRYKKFKMPCLLNENLYFSVCNGIKMRGELYIIIYNQ